MRSTKLGKNPTKRSPQPTPINTKKWSALNLSRRAIRRAIIEIIAPDMIKNICKRVMKMLEFYRKEV